MRALYCLCLVLILVGIGSSQSIIYGPGSSRAFQTPYAGPQTIVRDSQARLYVIYRYQVGTQWDVAIAQSTDTGASWNLTWQTGFAALGSDFGSYSPCIAIDSQDNLHCAWSHRVAFTGSRIPQTMRYNRYEAATKSWGTEWIVTPTPKFELNNCCLAVDQNDHVWFAHGWNTGSWHTYIERSDKPFASDGKFTRYAPYYATSGYSMHPCIRVDALGRIHFTYYSSGTYGIYHQWIDPAATTPAWSTRIVLSNHSGHVSRAEYSSVLAGDNFGNMYLIYTVDPQYPTNNGSADTEFYLRKWDGATQKWGNPVLVHNVPIATWATSGTNDRIISCACDESTSELYFVYRDFTNGEYVLGRWRGNDTEPPTIYAKLQSVTPPGPPNYVVYPHFRGSLWPRTNRTSLGLDLTYSVGDSTAPTPTYTDYFEHFGIGSMSSTGRPRIGTTYPIDLFGAAEAGRGYVAAVNVSGLGNMVRIGRRFLPLVADRLFFLSASNQVPTVFVKFQGMLDASGQAQAGLVIPGVAALVGIPFDSCFVTYDVGGLQAISNPWHFQVIQ